MNHYTYMIYNIETNRYYIGVRSCKCDICNDSYMGSSSIWTKSYIATNRYKLQKIIIKTFRTRKDANDYEVHLLKICEFDDFCINRYFGYTPDCSGTKQNKEWVSKRKRFGVENGMFGKHHTKETKNILSQKLRGHYVSDETKIKIGLYHKNKIVSDATRSKISNLRKIARLIIDTETNKKYIMPINDFAKQNPNLNINANSMRKAYQDGYMYKKRYIIKKI